MDKNSSYSPLMPNKKEPENKITLIITITVIVLMLIGGLFIINSQKTSTEEIDTTNQDVYVESTSTKLDDISNDIDNLDTNQIDSGLDQLDQEINNL